MIAAPLVRRLNLSADDVRRRLRDLDRLIVGSVKGRFSDDQAAARAGAPADARAARLLAAGAA